MSKTATLKRLATDIGIAERSRRELLGSYAEPYYRGRRDALIEAFLLVADDGSRTYIYVAREHVESYVECTSDEYLERLAAQWSDDLGYGALLRKVQRDALRAHAESIRAESEKRAREAAAERAAAKAALVEADPFHGVA